MPFNEESRGESYHCECGECGKCEFTIITRCKVCKNKLRDRKNIKELKIGSWEETQLREESKRGIQPKLFTGRSGEFGRFTLPG